MRNKVMLLSSVALFGALGAFSAPAHAQMAAAPTTDAEQESDQPTASAGGKRLQDMCLCEIALCATSGSSSPMSF